MRRRSQEEEDMRASRRTRRRTRRNDFSICWNDIWWRFRDLRRTKKSKEEE